VKDTLNDGNWNVVISNFPRIVGGWPSRPCVLEQPGETFELFVSQGTPFQCLTQCFCLPCPVGVPNKDPNGLWNNIDEFVQVFNFTLSADGKMVMSQPPPPPPQSSSPAPAPNSMH
jgi:hypothetical protein